MEITAENIAQALWNAHMSNPDISEFRWVFQDGPSELKMFSDREMMSVFYYVMNGSIKKDAEGRARIKFQCWYFDTEDHFRPQTEFSYDLDTIKELEEKIYDWIEIQIRDEDHDEEGVDEGEGGEGGQGGEGGEGGEGGQGGEGVEGVEGDYYMFLNDDA